MQMVYNSGIDTHNANEADNGDEEAAWAESWFP